MTNRRAFEVEGLPHNSPIPSASRVGPIIWSSPVAPRDITNGEIPEDTAEQVENVFLNIGLVLAAAGVRYDNVGRIEFWLADGSDRSALNEVWSRYFPDEQSRPARQVQESTALPAGVHLMATFQAWAGE